MKKKEKKVEEERRTRNKTEKKKKEEEERQAQTGGLRPNSFVPHAQGERTRGRAAQRRMGVTAYE